MPLYSPSVQPFFNVKDPLYGARGDGTTDDTVAITAAIAAASTAGGGVVYVPAGTYISTTQSLVSNVRFMGAGVTATTIKLKNGANADLFSALSGSINLSATYATGSNTGVHNFGFSNLTLDGNKANQASGPSYPLRFYGYAFYGQDMAIINGFSGGMLCDWNPTASPTISTESSLVDMHVYNNNAIGIQWGGPSDSLWTNVVASTSGTINVHLAPNAGGIQAINCHTWNLGTGVTFGWLVEANLFLWSNSEAEGEGSVNLVLLGDYATIMGGAVYAGTLGSTAGGIQIGQAAGGTPYPGQIKQSAGVTLAVAPTAYTINTKMYGISVAGGCIWFANDGGGTVDIVAQVTGSGVFYSGNPNAATSIRGQISGITADGTIQKSGGMLVSATSYSGFYLTTASGASVFQVDTFDSPPNVNFFACALNMLNGSGQNLINFNGGFVSFGTGFDTQIYRADVGALKIVNTIAYGVSATTPDPGAAGTVTTANTGMGRVTPAANRTGCILQAGTVDGQQFTLVNNASAFTITFAASGTSHVALGTGAVLAANGKLQFIWDATKALWY